MLVGSLGSEGRLIICLFSQEGQKQRLYLTTVYKGRTKAVVVGPRIVMQGWRPLLPRLCLCLCRDSDTVVLGSYGQTVVHTDNCGREAVIHTLPYVLLITSPGILLSLPYISTHRFNNWVEIDRDKRPSTGTVLLSTVSCMATARGQVLQECR